MDYDCIIIGAGPAGATSARVLAGNGSSVVLLDKARFPRFKTCGGGLTTRCVEEIGLGLGGEILDSSQSVRAVISPNRITELEMEQTLASFVDRSSFDHYLLREAERAGAWIHEGIPITGIQYIDSGFVVRTGIGTFRAPYLLGADGANSIVNARLGVVKRDGYGKGISVNVPRESFHREPVMTFDFTAVPRGYGWIFPRKNTVSMGLYTTDPQFKGLPILLDRYLDSVGCTGHEDLEKHTYILPFWGLNYRQPDIPVILAGDAAGFVDTFSGEGISYAVRSGKVAAGCVHSWLRKGRFHPDELQSRYEREIISVLRTGRRLAKVFYGRKPLLYQIMASEPVLRMFTLAFLKGDDYRNLFKEAPKYLKEMFNVQCPMSNV